VLQSVVGGINRYTALCIADVFLPHGHWIYALGSLSLVRPVCGSRRKTPVDQQRLRECRPFDIRAPAVTVHTEYPIAHAGLDVGSRFGNIDTQDNRTAHCCPDSGSRHRFLFRVLAIHAIGYCALPAALLHALTSYTKNGLSCNRDTTHRQRGSQLKACVTNRRTNRLILAGCVSFVLLTAFAMAMYPGGTHLELETDGYDFFDNTFSELGRVRGYLGQTNAASAASFALATVVAGASLGAFFRSEAERLQNRASLSRYARLTKLFGFFTAFGFTFVGLTPTDLVPALHYLFVYVAFVSYAFTVTVLLFGWGSVPDRNGNVRRHRLFAYGAFLVALCVYLVVLLLAAGTGSTALHAPLVTGQKLVVYAAIVVVATICVTDEIDKR